MDREQLVKNIAKKFRCFGGGTVTVNNPISQALRDKAPSFAAGVNVREVVDYILEQTGHKWDRWCGPGDDEREYR